jgi:hypothetical protein
MKSSDSRIHVYFKEKPAEWAQEEQKRLEQALRTYGAKEPERWEKICSAVSLA